MSINWRYETRLLSEIKPWVKNPRRITKVGLDDLTRSITKFGLPEPIVLNTDNTIIGGHARYLTLKKEGITEAFCAIPERILAPEELEELNIRLNRNIAGEFDFDKLANEFDVDKLLDWGFTKEELNCDPTASNSMDSEPNIDQAEELKEKYGVALGQIWKLGNHKIFCGDSSSEENLKKLMGDEKSTLVFTDPPYGVSIGKKNAILNTFQKPGRSLDNLEMDDMNPDELYIMLLAIFKNWRSIMADDCSVFVCSPQGGGLGMRMMMMMKDVGLEVRHILNWVKNCPTFSMGRLDYDYQHEPILFTWTKTHKRIKAGQFQTSLWAIDKPRANKLHPTIKPVELPENAILNHTEKNDIVVDMFLGSGTTLIAAENTGRFFRGCEISPNYVAVAIQRFVDTFGGVPEILQ
jgi:DNA modification methylase